MPKPLPSDTWNNLFYPPPDYQYFLNSDRFPFEPGAPGFSWKNAWWLADASVLAYVKDWRAVSSILDRAGFADKAEIGLNPQNSTKGFFAAHTVGTPFAMVAFRGTDRDDDRTARTDADLGPVERDGYLAHAGFLKALDHVWDGEVQPLLTEFRGRHPAAPVYFTGHSLGAALAAIAATRFDGGGAWYTIGSPRVGDDRFVAAVLRKTASVFRFVNSQDIVTLIPPEVPLARYFRHAGIEKYIDRTGAIHDHPSEFDKGVDAARGAFEHDGAAALAMIGHPGEFWLNARRTLPLVDPPPYIVGNHSPARYPVRIWNFYSGL